MKDNDWRFLQDALRSCGYEVDESVSPEEELHIVLAQRNGVSAEQALEWLASLFQILPLDQTVKLPLKAEDPFYTVAGIQANVPRFYEKSASLTDLGGDEHINVGSNYQGKA